MKLDALEKLDTPVEISFINNLFQPGIFSGKEFVQSSTYMIHNNTLEISLFPTFHVGQDVVRISIPGWDVISIPFVVSAGDAYRVVLSEPPRSLLPGALFTGVIQVVDK